MASSEQAEQPSQVRGVGLPCRGDGDPSWRGRSACGRESGRNPEPPKPGAPTSCPPPGPAPPQVLAAGPSPGDPSLPTLRNRALGVLRPPLSACQPVGSLELGWDGGGALEPSAISCEGPCLRRGVGGSVVLGCSSGEGPDSIRVPTPPQPRLLGVAPVPASSSLVTFALPLPSWRVGNVLGPSQCVGRKGTHCKQQTPPSFRLRICPCFPEFGCLGQWL